MYRYNTNYTIQYLVNDLHWLSISAHVTYTVLLIVAKSQLGLALKYLCEHNMSEPLSARSSRPVQLADRSSINCIFFPYSQCQKGEQQQNQSKPWTTTERFGHVLRFWKMILIYLCPVLLCPRTGPLL